MLEFDTGSSASHRTSLLIANLASTSTGINMDCVARMGEIVKQTAWLTRDRDAIGCAVCDFCQRSDNPFMAGAFHGVGEAEACINVGVSGPGVVMRALEQVRGLTWRGGGNDKENSLQDYPGRATGGYEASRRLGVPFGIVDLSLAPTPAIGDSVAAILEEMGLESTGLQGTTAALALLNDAVKKGGLMASSHAGGLPAPSYPGCEDAGMIAAVERGALTLGRN